MAVRDVRPPAEPEPAPRWRWIAPALLILAWLLVGGALGPLAAKTSQIQENDNAAYLPAEAESTQVNDLLEDFSGEESTPAVVVYARDGGLTDADRAEVAADARRIQREFSDQLAGDVVGPIPSRDGEALQLVAPFAGSDSVAMADDLERLREIAQDTGGLTAHVTGPAGVLADLLTVFEAVDSILIWVTGSVVLIILILVYRSPFLPLIVLGCAGMALALANAVVYLLASEGVVTISGQNQGILNVLVLGAATDYALLLVARFREELRRHVDRVAATRVALRASFEPILASGGTVILGLLCLLASEMGVNRNLGPIAAVGIGAALLSMLTLLPAALALWGRPVFWPFQPRHGSAPTRRRGVWARVARGVDRRPRLIWTATVVTLAVVALGIVRLDASGVPQTEAFLAEVDSKAGQKALAAHYPGGSGSPAIVIARADRLAGVVAAAERVDGVAAVAPYPGERSRLTRGETPGAPRAGEGPEEPKVVDGLVRVDVILDDEPDSKAATATVRQLREELREVGGAEAKVGGFTAVDLDIQQTAQRDRMLILPLVLAVVLLVLMALLRSVTAPLLLIATVVLSFLATLGVSGWVFQDLLGWPGMDSALPLFAFVFLVALGIDYNIFLMTRVREEALRHGTREGTLAGLTATGGVITSAGAVLAATFASLAVLPMMFLVQIGFMVAFGVLLDTLVVRSLLVPALTLDIGGRVWWPSRIPA